MANKSIPQTIYTITALDNFVDWLVRSMNEAGVTNAELADYVGCERKTIIAWRTKTRAPRLDQMAKCYAYFGKSTIIIPITRIARDEA